MRRLILAVAALAALPSLAFGAVTYSRSQTGAVGSTVNCTLPDGSVAKCVLQGVVLNDSTGVEKGTSGNPVYTAPASGAAGLVGVKGLDGAAITSATNPFPTTQVDTRTPIANITAADVATTSTAGQNSVNVITGAPTANSSVTWALNGQAAITLSVSGTFVQTAQIETSADGGTTYVASTAKQLGTAATSSSVTGIGSFRVDVTGATNVRLRTTARTSGTLAVYATNSPAPGLTQVINPVPLRGADGLTSASSSNPVPTSNQGLTASGAALTEAPLADGCLAKTALPTAVADGQKVAQLCDKYGRVISPSMMRENKGIQQTDISGTGETTIVTADASNKLELYCLVLTNTNSANIATATIKDSTAGTTRGKFVIPASDTRGFCITADSGWPQSAVNNNWTATLAGTAPTVSVTATYLKAGS